MQILTVATKLDWSEWTRGLVGAIISGGSSAVTAAISVNIIDPKDWNIMYGGMVHLLELMGTCFLISGLISMFKYLQSHPVPDATKP